MTSETQKRSTLVSIARSLKNRLLAAQKELEAWRGVKHHAGPKHIQLNPHDVTVISMVKNAAPWRQAFIEHYRNIGARRFIIIDNGSTDGTVEFFAKFPECTILKTSLPVAKFMIIILRQTIMRFCSGKWCIVVDQDEFFDCPGLQSSNIERVVRDLDRDGYTCVVTQMLDMLPTSNEVFSGGTLQDLERHFPYCDVSAVEKIEYFDENLPLRYFIMSNTIGSSEVTFMYGGIRASHLGARVCLTKHALVKVAPGVNPYSHNHAASGVRCADYTGVLRHYKFAGDFVDRTKRQVKEKSWNVTDDSNYLQALEKVEGNLNLLTGRPAANMSVTDLVAAGFLVGRAKKAESGSAAKA